MNYFADNFILLLVAIGMVLLTLPNFRAKKKETIFTVTLVANAVALSLFSYFEEFLKAAGGPLFVATLMGALGYMMRPLTLYLFIRLTEPNKKTPILLLILIGANVLLYASALFVDVPALSHLCYYLTPNDGKLEFNRGLLGYTAHVVSALILVYLLYLASRKIKGKHKGDFLVLLFCAIVAIAAVALESLSVAANLLNPTIAVSCLFFYLYNYIAETKRDALTGLFNRRTFYADVARLGKEIDGVIQIDMNGLKTINDTMGHACGDKALRDIGGIIEDACVKTMYAYRVGGDEYTILCVKATKESMDQTAAEIRRNVESLGLHIAVGIAYPDEEHPDLEKRLRAAEKRMYQDKEDYYVRNGLDRRRA